MIVQGKSESIDYVGIKVFDTKKKLRILLQKIMRMRNIIQRVVL